MKAILKNISKIFPGKNIIYSTAIILLLLPVLFLSGAISDNNDENSFDDNATENCAFIIKVTNAYDLLAPEFESSFHEQHNLHKKHHFVSRTRSRFKALIRLVSSPILVIQNIIDGAHRIKPDISGIPVLRPAYYTLLFLFHLF